MLCLTLAILAIAVCYILINLHSFKNIFLLKKKGFITKPMSAPSSNDLPVSSMLMLNDYCLMDIMDQLSMSDSICFALTCSRICDIYKQRFKKRFLLVNFDKLKYLPLEDQIDFLKRFGHFIKEFKWILPFFIPRKVFDYLGTCCINLRAIKLSDRQITEHDMCTIFPYMKKLHTVVLDECNLSDDSLLTLIHLSQLKTLDLSNNVELTGLNMNLLPASIESLNLSFCSAIKGDLLPEICKALPQLKLLNIFGVFTTMGLFRDLCSDNCCDSLETLIFTNIPIDEESEAIAMLPSLKNLSLSNDTQQILPQLFALLVTHKSKQLECLDINGTSCLHSDEIQQICQMSALRTLSLNDNSVINDPEMVALSELKQLEYIKLNYCIYHSSDALLRLILDCPKLQLLDLNWCPHITDELLSDLICELRLQVGQRFLPVTLKVNGTKITETMLQDVDVVSKQIVHVIQINSK